MLPIDGNFFQNAVMYDFLANYYKYTRPDLHVHYYQLHLLSMQNAFFYASTGLALPEKRIATARVLLTAPDSPAMNIFINQNPVYQNVESQTISNYASLPEGCHHFNILQADKKNPAASTPRFTILSGNIYTLLVSGSPENLHVDAIQDDPFVPAEETKIRFAHFSLETPDLDIAVKNGDVVFQKVAFRNATDYLALTPMAVDLEVRVAGSRDVILPLERIRFEKDVSYTIYLLASKEKASQLTAIMLTP
ncbi:DUF4397 domain-containing protein [Bacillus sp. V5-8f]|uniref:DUF4397 domain-containing protein n=1 Tax=Bacillus sp. V5-8f TaxID=2053044 RepID=UPI000C787FC7|nr:DUF4397 domain-containing protein [Bacillus sp. V5-8f]PLT34960.1 hypothetical protein CUU64_06090 [Bacillus sp. V5-8f]